VIHRGWFDSLALLAAHHDTFVALSPSASSGQALSKGDKAGSPQRAL